MFNTNHQFSTVTAVLPNSTANRVVEAIVAENGASVLIWKARGTLLHDHWLKRFLPPIGPVKTVLQMLVPKHEVDRVISTVVEKGRLHQQATGAVFSTPCDHVYLGSEFHTWPGSETAVVDRGDHRLSENLSAIHCVVDHQLSDRIAKAAIDAGGHGPIVYYCEGRGLRDRLGWLRITKEHEQEVLMVIADESDADEIFDAMAKAGELHLPGRGIMYRLSIDKGMFNLPSRVYNHHHDANMQQIINAIDHLTGHAHWRDQEVSDVGGEGRSAGLDFLKQQSPALENQVCLSAIVKRDFTYPLIDMMLDAGAPGLNVTYARFAAAEEQCQVAHARINEEYGVLRCIIDEETAERVCRAIEENAENNGIRDLCMLVNPVPRIARYVPGSKDYREAPKHLPLAS